MTDYYYLFHDLHISNGIFAAKAAAFLAVLAGSAAIIFFWRLWLMRGDWREPRGWFRIEVFFWLAVLFVGLAGNRVSVMLFYRGITGPGDWWPIGFSIQMAVALLRLAYIYTRDACSHKGWLSLLLLASVAAVLG